MTTARIDLANAMKYLANSVRLQETAEFEPEESQALLDEVSRLRAALTKYGRHEPDCDSDDGWNPGACTCGFDEVSR